MSEVKRLEMDHKGLPFVDDNGVYVLYEDYAELKAQRDALAAENAAQKEYLKECSVVQGEGNWNSAAEKSVYVPAIDWMPPTPATDVYLNSVRAEGVEMVLKNMNLDSDREEYASWFAAQLRSGEQS